MGATITNYKIMILQKDGGYSEELSNCDGSIVAIVDSVSCTVPLSLLVEPPFSLELGDPIYAHIIAVNHYGEADPSPDGGGALIVKVPDAPEDLEVLADQTSATELAFTFESGDSNGG
jgi:hypothetical protein